MVNDGWAEDLTYWLSDPDVEFGDVFSTYDTDKQHIGEAMLVLFETEGSWGRRTYRGGFYGLSGDRCGLEVHEHSFASINGHSRDAIRLEELYNSKSTGRPMYGSLPKEIGNDGHPYYESLEYRKLNPVLVASRGLAIASIISPFVRQALTYQDLVAGPVAMKSAYESEHTSYPVIPLARPGIGNAPLLESFRSPRGHYR